MDMAAVINFDDYKETLLNYYKHIFDENQKEIRVSHVNKYYSDEYLMMIVERTQAFIYDLLRAIKRDRAIIHGRAYYRLELCARESIYLTNGCCGGYACDELFAVTCDEEALISKQLLGKFFGDGFKIALENRRIVNYNENGEMESDKRKRTFTIDGPFEILDWFYAQYKVKTLVRSASFNQIKEQVLL